jgi:HlyD family secretion protein
VHPRIRRSLRKWLPWMVAALVAVGVIYYFKFAPLTVTVRPVEKEEVVARVMGTGTLEARFQTTISPKIQGRIVELTADQNDRVEENRLLVRLDDAELRQEVYIAKATLDAAQATVDRLKADEARTKAVFEQARRDYDRYSGLAASQSVSKENIEKSREKLDVANAEVAKGAAATMEGERQFLTAEERLRYQEARLADTRILSPFDGLVVRRDREAGDVVVPGASIFRLISLKEMWIAAWVDESAMSGLAVGHPAKVVFRSLPAREFPGCTARMGREVDRETREFRVDVMVNVLPENWAVGQRAEVYIETGRKPGVPAIPVRALVWRESKPGVYVVRDGYAVWREIGIGLRGVDKVEVTSGLAPNELFVTAPDPSTPLDGRRVKSK